MDPKESENSELAEKPAPRLSELSLQALFHEVRGAQRRLLALQARSQEEAGDLAVLELFQALETAHEELRVAEEHIHSQADALALARSTLDVESRRYRELFEAAPEAYFLTDLHGNIRLANRRAAAMMNVEPAHLLGKPLRLFVDPQHLSDFTHTLESLRAHERASWFELRMLPRHSVVAFWAGVSVCSATGLDGRPVALRWLIHDIGVAKNHEERLKMRIAALQKEGRECARELEATRYLLEHCMVDGEVRADPDPYAIPHRRLRRRVRQMRVALSLLSNWLQVLQREQMGPQVRSRGFLAMGRAVKSITNALDKLFAEHEHGPL